MKLQREEQTEVFGWHEGVQFCNLADIVCMFNIAIECELVKRKQSDCYQVKASRSVDVLLGTSRHRCIYGFSRPTQNASRGLLHLGAAFRLYCKATRNQSYASIHFLFISRMAGGK